jgi:hypothetical protein
MTSIEEEVQKLQLQALASFTATGYLSQRYQRQHTLPWTATRPKKTVVKLTQRKSDPTIEPTIAVIDEKQETIQPAAQTMTKKKYEPLVPLNPDAISFNASLFTKTQLKDMHPMLRAKIAICSQPPEQVQKTMNESLHRVKTHQKDQHQKQETLLKQALNNRLRRNGKFVSFEEETAAKNMSDKAKHRIISERLLASELKAQHLQTLIEGQRNSIDAIRLKEFLVEKKTAYKRWELGEKDRFRVLSLLKE